MIRVGSDLRQLPPVNQKSDCFKRKGWDGSRKKSGKEGRVVKRKKLRSLRRRVTNGGAGGGKGGGDLNKRTEYKPGQKKKKKQGKTQRALNYYDLLATVSARSEPGNPAGLGRCRARKNEKKTPRGEEYHKKVTKP